VPLALLSPPDRLPPLPAKQPLWRAGIALLTLGLIPVALAERQADLRDATFTAVTELVRDHFHDPQFAGLDWDETVRRHAPDIRRAETDEEFSAALNALLAELRTSHTRYYATHEPEYYQLSGLLWSIIGPQLAQDPPAQKPGYPGIGIATFVSEGRNFVRNVFDGLPAAEAGLLAGDEILGVDGAPFAPVHSFVGKVGQAVRLQIRREANGPPLEFAVTPRLLTGDEIFIEAMRASARVESVDGVRIGYVHAWAFTGDVFFHELVSLLNGPLQSADALVLDLRDGWGGAAPRYLWPFLAPPLEMEVIQRDSASRRLQEAWTKPVALLVNEGSRSGKELLAYYFQKAALGPVVGARTAGAVIFGRPFVLPDGNILYLAVNDLRVDGRRLEGLGVTPDVEVSQPLEYSAGHDPQRARAFELMVKAVRARRERA
jgi:carboxyl-terminal processing protease